MDRGVYYISLSAFFADMGYIAIVSFLPLLVVHVFNEPPYVYGTIEALNYGGGFLFSMLGGRVADRVGRKRIAILGNIGILFMSLSGIPHFFLLSAGLIVLGWWMRNFRTPARRALLASIVKEGDRNRAFGLLHGLDQTGAFLSSVYISTALFLNLPLSTIILFTALPLLASTTFLLPVRETAPLNRGGKEGGGRVRGVVVASAVFGLTSYSVGFPVLTAFQASGKLYIGTADYGVFSIMSALVGFLVGRLSAGNERLWLALAGYLMTGLFSVLLGLSYDYGEYLVFLFTGLIGASIGVIETFEPSLISLYSDPQRLGTNMGYLSLGRTLGVVINNVMMGFLYTLSPLLAYIYIGGMALLASIILLNLVN